MHMNFRHAPECVILLCCRLFGCVLLLNQLTTMCRSKTPLRFIWSICSASLILTYMLINSRWTARCSYAERIEKKMIKCHDTLMFMFLVVCEKIHVSRIKCWCRPGCWYQPQICINILQMPHLLFNMYHLM